MPDDDEEIEIDVLFNEVDITQQLDMDIYNRLCEEAIERIKGE
jgi:hypothetical protein